LEATVTYLHHEQHIGYQRLLQLCTEVFGLSLSPGGAAAIVERAGKNAQGEAEDIAEQVRRSRVIGSNETSARVHGRNWRQWVFVGENCEYHFIRSSRGYDVIEAFIITGTESV
jgi:hypothetical protein